MASRARTTSLVAEATEALREEILSGELAPGDRVHLVDAAERLEMSIAPIREALRSLAADGLVISMPQRGYRVSELNIGDFRDVYRLRLRLDPMAVELGVPRLDAAQMSNLREAFSRLEHAYLRNDRAAHSIEHRRFHFTIYEASGSAWLLRFIAALWENSVRYQRLSGDSGQRGPIADRIGEHRDILLACEARDVTGAAELMHEHLLATIRTVEAALEAEQEALKTGS